MDPRHYLAVAVAAFPGRDEHQVADRPSNPTEAAPRDLGDTKTRAIAPITEYYHIGSQA